MDFLLSEWMGKPFWMWKGFLLIVLVLLAFDLARAQTPGCRLSLNRLSQTSRLRR